MYTSDHTSCSTPFAHRSDHECVRFAGDAARPTMLMLPQGCYVIAPTLLPAGGAQESFPFSTEFGALLEPGEGFGWQGYQGDASPGEEAEEAADAADAADAAEAAAPGEVPFGLYVI